jgi:hypothetical protein
MLCGRLPFEATTEYELMQAHISRAPQPCTIYAPDLPAEVDHALMRALAKNPAERFATVEEFGRAFGTAAVQLQAVDIVRELVARAAPIPSIPQRTPSSEKRGSSVPVAGLSSPAPASRSPSVMRRQAPLLVMGAAAAVAVGVVGFIFFDSRQPVTPAPQVAQVELRSAVPSPAPAPPPAVAKRELEAKPETSRIAEPQIALQTDPRAGEREPAEKPPVLAPEIARPKSPEKQAPAISDSGALRPSLQVTPESEKLPDRSLLRPAEKPPAVADKPPAASAEKPADEPAREASAAPPVEKKPELSAMPAGPANYQGRVVAWLSPSTLMVRSATGGGFEKLTLYGIRDKPVANQKEADAVRDHLEAFMAKYGWEATCFNRYSTDAKQTQSHCFIDKHDMALWAIESKLGQRSGSAPDNYSRTSR